MLPAPHKITHRRWSEDGTDAHGNPIPVYTDEDVWVYGWSTPAPEERTSERVVIDLRLFAKPDLTVDSRDRFVLPDGIYRAQGPAQDYGYGPFGWEPGVVVNLQRVEG